MKNVMKGKLTKYGSLILNKNIRESLLIQEGDKFILAKDADAKEEVNCVYFIRTRDNDASLNIERKHGLFYIRLSRYLRAINLQLPCNCLLHNFKDNEIDGFKLEFINSCV